MTDGESADLAVGLNGLGASDGAAFNGMAAIGMAGEVDLEIDAAGDLLQIDPAGDVLEVSPGVTFTGMSAAVGV